MTTESPPAPAPHRPVGGAALQCTACHRIIGLGESLEALQYGADTCCEDEQLRSPDDCPGLLRLVAVAVTDLPHPVGVDQQPPSTDGWPLWALQSLDLGVGASADLDTAVDLMPQVLAHRGMSVCRDVWQDQPDPQVATRWSVQLHDRPRRPSGIYAPDHTGRPGGWQVIAPLPPAGPVMTAMLPTVGWQALIWITTRTAHLYAVPDGETLMADLAVQADAGHVWFARAVVLP